MASSPQNRKEIHMKSPLIQLICRILILTLTTLSFQTSHAGMIGTGQAAAAATAQVERSTVINLLSRTDTASQLQSMGVDPQTAVDRVAAMTDEEVHSLAGKLEALPAGGDGLLALVLVGFFIWYFAFRK